MRRFNVVVTEAKGFPEQAASALSPVANLVLLDADRRDLLPSLSDADVLWIRLRNRIDAEIMDSAPKLKIICTPTTGLDHIDIEEANRRDIRILSLQGETEFLSDIRATAEHTIALILALLRKVPQSTAHVVRGGWNRDLFKGRELYKKTAGVVGYGRLGRIVARYLAAFGMSVLVSDPKADPASVEPCVTTSSFENLLTKADLVTVHANLCPSTVRLFGREQFALMKRGAWFINTARGGLVDEDALLEALRNGHLGGAALDVLCGEDWTGMGHHPLVAYARDHDNLLITPHIGGCTMESMERTEIFLADKLCAVLSCWQEAE